MSKMLSRRALLKSLSAMGCSAAAHPLMSTVTFASAPWENRLVVIILRGGMDGLDAVRPVGDPNYALTRKGRINDTLKLGGMFGLHPAFEPLLPLWRKGELGFAHATSTPYRDKRSHFDGQDLLEAGTGMDVTIGAQRDGWLNRLLQTVPGLTSETAFAVGASDMNILRGPAPSSHWSPRTELQLSAATQQLLEYIYHDDPIFRDAAAQAILLSDAISADRDAAEGDETADMMMDMMKPSAGKPERALAAFAADRLNHDTRIASFSISGWDTHNGQDFRMKVMLGRLADAILTLKAGLGDNWGRTTVLAMTEFGRTVRLNGSNGTDHGTAGAMLVAGGAVNGGRIFGRWPGLAEADMYDRRDLMPTTDVRAYAAWAMRGLFGLERSVLEGAVFPGLDMGADEGLLL